MPVAESAASSSKMSKSSLAATWPPWRVHLYKIPKDDLCGSQKDLIRSLELLDTITSMFDGNKPLPESTVATPDAPFTVFLPCLEILHLPIKDRSIFSLLSVEIAAKLAKFLFSSAVAMNDPATGFSNPLIKPSKSPLAMAIYKLACGASVAYGIFQSQAPENCSDWKILKGLCSAIILLTDESVTKRNEEEMKRLQETYKTQLTLDDLIEMSEVMNTALAMKAAEFSAKRSSENLSIVRNREFLDLATETLEIFLSNTEDTQKVSWYRCSNVYDTLGRTACSSFEKNESDCRQIEKIFQFYLKTATMDNDPLRQAWAAFDLALCKISSNGWYYSELKTLEKIGHDTMAICKPWVPPYFRKLILEGADMIERMLKAAKSMYPNDYNTRKLGMEVLFAVNPSEVDLFDLSDPNPRRRCSACDRESRCMSACSGCRKVYYCNVVCQKKHWKAGHKKTCGK